MRFAAACRYVLDTIQTNRMHTRSPRAARNTRSTVDKNHDKRNNDVVFTERKSDLELHHFTQLGTFTHEKRRDRAPREFGFCTFFRRFAGLMFFVF